MYCIFQNQTTTTPDSMVRLLRFAPAFYRNATDATHRARSLYRPSTNLAATNVIRFTPSDRELKSDPEPREVYIYICMYIESYICMYVRRAEGISVFRVHTRARAIYIIIVYGPEGEWKKRQTRLNSWWDFCHRYTHTHTHSPLPNNTFRPRPILFDRIVYTRYTHRHRFHIPATILYTYIHRCSGLLRSVCARIYI